MLPRPAGHIAGNLDFLAIALHSRIKHASAREVFVAWVADDGCVFMASAAHPGSRAVTEHAPDQVFQRYRKAPGFGRADILDDLAEARQAFASRTLQSAQEEAATPPGRVTAETETRLQPRANNREGQSHDSLHLSR